MFRENLGFPGNLQLQGIRGGLQGDAIGCAQASSDVAMATQCSVRGTHCITCIQNELENGSLAVYMDGVFDLRFRRIPPAPKRTYHAPRPVPMQRGRAEIQAKHRETAALAITGLGGKWICHGSTHDGGSGAGEHRGNAPIVVEPAKSATLPELMTEARTRRSMWVQRPTAYGDHLRGFDILRAMAAHGPSWPLAWRWLRRDSNRYSMTTGRQDRGDFARDTGVLRALGSIIAYRPIIAFRQGNGIPIIALNADQELTSEIRRVVSTASRGNCAGAAG